MKSLFSDKDIDMSEKLPNGINDQKRLEKVKVESITNLLRDKDDCTLYSMSKSHSNRLMVFYTVSIATTFRNFSDKSVEEFVDEIYEDMITRKLMGDF